ncbi:Os09g0391700 [Oryza sativa Japonica Group]|uniref:KIB1-4 beta-propeller domain-containing protein n=2 Tax=Oryza sativa subsp. japonica TaxID=39947 RepID=A3BYH5_ORYSJ|nr:hypothetical protein OsJ_29236 [Oryza sativa Japonica Group]BAD26530.1 hypothetical protein [Oryza sativa Japonica Group]BAT07904.1 Os09g0391700 [Oryza sativa Japonica Group]
MEEKDNNECPSSLDPKLAPLLLFGGDDDDDATFMYSVRTRALLPRRSTTTTTWTPRREPTGGGPRHRAGCSWRRAAVRPHRARRLSYGTLSPAAGSPCLPTTTHGTLLTHSCDRMCLLSRRRPTDPGCVVVVVDFDDTVLWYCRPGDLHGVVHHYLQPGTPHHEHRDCVGWAIGNLTAIDGKFYTDFTDHVAVLEFSPEPVFTVTAVDGDHGCPAGYTRLTGNLVESNGDLHHVFFSHPIGCSRIVARVSVYKLSVATQKQRSAWVKVDSLDGRVFFVGIDSLGVGASLDAKETGLKGNCIYYWGINGKVLNVYDMKRGTTVVINPGENLPPQVLMPTR